MAALRVSRRGALVDDIIGGSVGTGKSNDSLDAFDPVVLLLGGRSGDPVDRVVSLHDPAVRLRLAGLDHLVLVVGDEELEAVLGGGTQQSQGGEILNGGRRVCWTSTGSERSSKRDLITLNFNDPLTVFQKSVRFFITINV